MAWRPGTGPGRGPRPGVLIMTAAAAVAWSLPPQPGVTVTGTAARRAVVAGTVARPGPAQYRCRAKYQGRLGTKPAACAPGPGR